MKIRMLGLDHKTAPIAVREEFSFSPAETAAFLQKWNETFPDFEAVLVSTCNRTELYVGSQNGSLPASGAILDLIADQKGTRGKETAEKNRSETEGANLDERNDKKDDSGPKDDSDGIPPFIQIREDAEAVDHLFSVAASLESMVLGEPQILAQIKEAYRIAADEGTVGIMTHSAFQNALKAAKRVSAETDIFRHRISLPAIAVSDFALEIFEKLSDKRTLVLGAGEMAEETLRYLVDAGGKEIVVANRSREKGDALADRFGGSSVDWNARFAELAKADLVIAATGAVEPIVTPTDYQKIASERRGRPLFLVDLSVPRNLDEKLGQFPNVYLYSIDDLKETCRRNRKSRDQEVPKAKRILRQETDSFMKEIRLRDFGALIRELRAQWNLVKDSEVERLFHKCHDLGEREQEEIRYAFDRLLNKLLHQPMKSLRSENEKERGGGLLEAMMKLFRPR